MIDIATLLVWPVAILILGGAIYFLGRYSRKEVEDLRRKDAHIKTRKRMDDAPKYLDPGAARDAMRVRDPKRK